MSLSWLSASNQIKRVGPPTPGILGSWLSEAPAFTYTQTHQTFGCHYQVIFGWNIHQRGEGEIYIKLFYQELSESTLQRYDIGKNGNNMIPPYPKISHEVLQLPAAGSHLLFLMVWYGQRTE